MTHRFHSLLLAVSLAASVCAPVLTAEEKAPGKGESPDASATSPANLAEGRFDMALDASVGGFIAEADPRFGRFPITLEAWVRSKTSAREQIVVANEPSNSGSRWSLVIGAGSLIPEIQIPGFLPRRVRGSTPLTVEKWHHLAAILEPKRCRLILDGKVIADQAIQSTGLPSQSAGLGVGVAVDDRRTSTLRIDDVRISSGIREVLVIPTAPSIKDSQTIALWNFDESETEYLAHWTPGGLTNQRGLPYAHRIAEYEFDLDPDWIDSRWQKTIKGPMLRHSTQITGHETSPKNMVLFCDAENSGAVMFDEQRCGVMACVMNPDLVTDPARFGLLRRPTLNGELWVTVSPGKLWRSESAERAAIDESEIDFEGIRLHGRTAVPTYRIAGAKISERTTLAQLGGSPAIRRTIFRRSMQISNVQRSLQHTLAELSSPPEIHRSGDISVAISRSADQLLTIAVSSRKCQLKAMERDVVLQIPAGVEEAFDIFIQRTPLSPDSVGKLVNDDVTALCDSIRKLVDASPAAARFQEPPDTFWGEPLSVAGIVNSAETDDPWVIDTIEVPFQNRFQALFFITAIGFFSNGDAAVSTAHGDVWVVRGLDDSLKNVTWQRFATGLYQPLGLEIVKDQVFVLGRDELTRLHDHNQDGEADEYESFNHDVVITGKDHAYAMRLEHDAQGNFYFVKSGTEPHGSALLKIAADGSRLDVIARGFRHPYGMGCGPNGELTVADNEGDWVPSSKIDLIRPGGFYGYLGGQKTAPEGLRPESPLCYIPKVADNSCGGQLWNSSDRWGPYHRNGMLHLSWGRCTLYSVLQQQVGDIHQAAVVRFPNLTFLSGSGEAAFSPKDGQLYVVGLNGWQTGAVQDGCLQRVRYNGNPVRMPEAFEVLENGIRVSLTCEVDRKSASDAGNYQAEQWNYRWQAQYGSFHYSVQNPDEIGHDTVTISGVTVAEDQRSIFVEIPGLKPVDQFHLRMQISAADGKPLEFDLYSTIKALQSAKALSARKR
ncbi:MAG: LamG-like jellyroll fold domain-containing protein [Planctomyces sp.]